MQENCYLSYIDCIEDKLDFKDWKVIILTRRCRVSSLSISGGISAAGGKKMD